MRKGIIINIICKYKHVVRMQERLESKKLLYSILYNQNEAQPIWTALLILFNTIYLSIC